MTDYRYVRHCESAMNTTRELIGGRSNHTPPTARGLYQAALLGGHLRENRYTVDAIYSSGARRADMTAQYIIEAAGYDAPVLIDERLQEVAQGEWEGRHREEVYTEAVIRDNRLHELDGCLPGAESIKDAQNRMIEFITEMNTKHKDERLLVVSHGLAIRSLVGSIRGLSKSAILELETPNVSLTHIVHEHGITKVDYVGKTVITE